MIENIRLSLRGILSHKMRSFLTMLGIIIGIAAIIAIVSTIKGTNDQIQKNLVGSGTNAITVQVQQSDWEYDFSQGIPSGFYPVSEDTKQQLAAIDHVSQVSLFHSRQDYTGIYHNDNGIQSGYVMGIDESYLGTADLTGFETDDPGEEHPMAGVELTGTYCSRSELHEYVERLNRLADGCEEDLSILYDIKYDHPYRSIGDYEKTEADYHGIVSRSSHVDCTYTEGAMINLLLDMRYEDRLGEFGWLVDFGQNIAGVVSIDMPDDLMCSFFSYGISFPTIYEVLSRSGYPVSGTKDDFTFEGIDGSTYEMSESFIENDWYYYIKDGEHVPMEAYFYDHFYVGKVKEFTGIEVAEKWMIDREMKQGNETGK